MTNATCYFEECGRPSRARGLCSGHYQQQLKGANLRPIGSSIGRPRGQATKEAFFWARVEKAESCWTWTGAKTSLGYGQLKFDGDIVGAHRYSLELHGIEVTKDHYVDHLCHNPSCVNPSHLRATTHQKNMENRKGAHKNSKSGARGVYWDSAKGNWHARVRQHGKTVYSRRFDSLDEANEAVQSARARIYK